MCECKCPCGCDFPSNQPGWIPPEPKRQPHKHAALIKAWADGAEIECLKNRLGPQCWVAVTKFPNWHVETVYRVKPVPKPDTIHYTCLHNGRTHVWHIGQRYTDNVKVIYDGETGKLKSVSMLD